MAEEPTEPAVTTETEVAPSAVIDQTAVAVDESASPSPAEEPAKAGGGFDSPFNPSPVGLSMIERLEKLEAVVFR